MDAREEWSMLFPPWKVSSPHPSPPQPHRPPHNILLVMFPSYLRSGSVCLIVSSHVVACGTGAKTVQVSRKESRVTVNGYVDPNKVLKRVRNTGKRAELWPYVPYNLVSYPYVAQAYDKKAPAGYVKNVVQALPSPSGANEKLTTLFSDENPNACSIMWSIGRRCGFGTKKARNPSLSVSGLVIFCFQNASWQSAGHNKDPFSCCHRLCVTYHTWSCTLQVNYFPCHKIKKLSTLKIYLFQTSRKKGGETYYCVSESVREFTNDILDYHFSMN